MKTIIDVSAIAAKATIRSCSNPWRKWPELHLCHPLWWECRYNVTDFAAILSLAQVLKNPSAFLQNHGSDGLVSGGFFVDPADERLWASYRATFSERIPSVVEDAERICRHEFDLLGSGLRYMGHPIDWHVDPVSGYRWPKKRFTELKNSRPLGSGADIKWPWELSRMQHLPTLGKAYRLTGNERYAREAIGQITHWIDDNPCPNGVNWMCAMDVAIRIMNVAWGYLLVRDSAAVSQKFRSQLAVSLMQHGQYILFNLEYSIADDGSIMTGNHYLADIVGLLHLGLLCPEFKAAAEWRSVGLRALTEEMERQVHPDGSDYESSVAYHRLVLELFTAGALLCHIHQVPLAKSFWDRLERMYEFVLYVTRPDGKAPLVGDSDDGRLFVLSDYGKTDRTDFRYLLSIGAVLFNRSDMMMRAGDFSEDGFWLLGPAGLDVFESLNNDSGDLPTVRFPQGGFYVMRKATSYLLASCGTVGTGGQGNHKHNDLLSFELCAGDKAFIVDPGTYCYTSNVDGETSSARPVITTPSS